MNIILRRRGTQADAMSESPPSRGEAILRDMPAGADGIRKLEVPKMVQYVQQFCNTPDVVTVAQRLVQLCEAKDKLCEMNTLFNWVKIHMRYVNDPVDNETIKTAPRMIGEILTPPEVISAILGPELIQQMKGFGLGSSVISNDPRKSVILCRGCFTEKLSGPAPSHSRASGDCDDGCLHPDQKLWVRIDGKISMVPVKSLARYFVPVKICKAISVGAGGISSVSDKAYMAPCSDSVVEVPSLHGVGHKTAKPIWRRVVGLYHKIGPSDLVKITVSGGSTLTCTENHLLYRNDSKRFTSVRAGDLKKGDTIVGVNGMPESPVGDMPVTEDDLFFLGFWVADGCYDEQHGPKFSCGNDVRMVEKVRSWALTKEARDGPAKSSISKSRIGDVLVHSRRVMSWMKELGFSGFSETKRVPEWIFSLPDHGVAHFLRGYFTGDGSMWKRTDGFTCISASSVSAGLAEDIRDLLFRLSIRATLSVQKHCGGYSENTKTINVITVNSRNGVERFLAVVGNFRDVTVSLRSSAKSKYHVSWRTVQSMERVRTNEIFDLEVESDKIGGISPDNGNVYSVGGLLTHNSTFLATLLAAIGITPRFRFGGQEDPSMSDGCNYHHVWVQAQDDKGNWIDMDVTEKRSKLGWWYEGFGCTGVAAIFPE